MTDCVVCDDLGCEHCPRVGFDSLVDELMACHGYDRDEAELVATARLAGVPEAAVKRAAEAFECKPCECGGLCDECEGAA